MKFGVGTISVPVPLSYSVTCPYKFCPTFSGTAGDKSQCGRRLYSGENI